MSTATSHFTASKQTARFAARFDAKRVSDELERTCARSFADTFAVGVAGRNELASLAALHYLERAGLLDYDDVTVPLRGHPSVVLWPALIAVAEAQSLRGARLTTAYVVGFEVSVAVLCSASTRPRVAA